MNIGLAIKGAIARGAQHQQTAQHRLMVLVTSIHGLDSSGLHIIALAWTLDGNGVRSFEGRGYRYVSWEHLDAAATDLIRLVDEAVAEAESAIGVKANA